MAECSESTGRMGTWLSLAARVTISPATTMVSLLAKAMGLWCSMARRVGRSPAKPTMEAKTRSMDSISIKSATESIPQNTLMSWDAKASCTCWYFVLSAIATALGSNSNACAINRSALLPAQSTSTENRSRWRRITFSAWVPIEPVDPNMAILFISLILYEWVG